MKVEMIVGSTKVEIGLDKLVLSMPYPKKLSADSQNPISAAHLAQYESEKSEFIAMMHYIKNMVLDNFKCHVKPPKNKDLKRYTAFFDDGGLMCTFMLGFCFGTGVINLEINPSKLTQNQYVELFGWLDIFFNHGYQELYSKATVSHAEFYVDVIGEDLSNLVMIGNSRRTNTIYKGTTYHGKRTAPKVTALYDKAKQTEIEGKLVRAEARINRNDIRFQDLVEYDLFNPFDNVLVANVNQLQSVASQHGKAQFTNRIKQLGLNGCGINIHTRKKIFADLEQNTVDWWEPDLFWAKHRELLSTFKPMETGLAL
jgi:hypothetical protein